MNKNKLEMVSDDDESGNISMEDIDELQTDERNAPHTVTQNHKYVSTKQTKHMRESQKTFFNYTNQFLAFNDKSLDRDCENNKFLTSENKKCITDQLSD